MLMKCKIKKDATFKTTKQVWKLRTSYSFLKNVLMEVPDAKGDDILDARACLLILGKIIARQIVQ